MVKTFGIELLFLNCLKFICCKEYGIGFLALDLVGEERIALEPAIGNTAPDNFL